MKKLHVCVCCGFSSYTYQLFIRTPAERRIGSGYICRNERKCIERTSS